MAASKTTLAYAAALLDGEGSVLLNQGRPRVAVCSTSKELTDWLLNHFDGHIVRSPPRGPACKASYSWRLNGQPALDFLHAVLPFIQERKKLARARLFLTEYPHDNFKQQFYAL